MRHKILRFKSARGSHVGRQLKCLWLIPFKKSVKNRFTLGILTVLIVVILGWYLIDFNTIGASGPSGIQTTNLIKQSVTQTMERSFQLAYRRQLTQQLSNLGSVVEQKVHECSLQHQVAVRLHNLEYQGWNLEHADYVDLSKRMWVMVVSLHQGQRVQLIVCRDTSDVDNSTNTGSADTASSLNSRELGRQASTQPTVGESAPTNQTTLDSSQTSTNALRCEEIIYELDPTKVQAMCRSHIPVDKDQP